MRRGGASCSLGWKGMVLSLLRGGEILAYQPTADISGAFRRKGCELLHGFLAADLLLLKVVVVVLAGSALFLFVATHTQRDGQPSARTPNSY